MCVSYGGKQTTAVEGPMEASTLSVSERRTEPLGARRTTTILPVLSVHSCWNGSTEECICHTTGNVKSRTTGSMRDDSSHAIPRHYQAPQTVVPTNSIHCAARHSGSYSNQYADSI